MLSRQIQTTTSKRNMRCDERTLTSGQMQSLNPIEKKDAGLKTDIANALWRDSVLRALDYYEIEVFVKNRVVTLNGHIASLSSQNRVENALRTVPGIVEIENNLISDDKLNLDVATALGSLEHTYGCKFFTGASHGVISITGIVRNKNVRFLAEKYASDTPNTRGVINNIQVAGDKPEVQTLPFLQPAIGENIFFLDWVSGVVKQVVMNPNNRRVIAMIVGGKFPSQSDGLNGMVDKPMPLERLIVIPMNTVRYLTKTSGFLYINSNERTKYIDLTLVHFVAPPQGWVPPYPYCPNDILFPVESDEKDI